MLTVAGELVLKADVERGVRGRGKKLTGFTDHVLGAAIVVAHCVLDL